MVDLVRLELSRGLAVLLVVFVVGQASGLPYYLRNVVAPSVRFKSHWPTMLFNCFVADGHWRARAALEPVVRADVRKTYAQQLALAKAGEKAAAWSAMEREVRRRLDSKVLALRFFCVANAVHLRGKLLREKGDGKNYVAAAL
jgi:hypothetical protein